MGLGNFILKKDQILLQQVSMEDAKDDDVLTLDNSPFLNGRVAKVSALSDMYIVDDYVVFNAGTSTKFLLDNQFYYLVEEDKIYLTQPTPIP